MQKHWTNTLKSLVPNGYRELNLSSKGKTPRPWLKLAPAPDIHTHAYTLKKSQKSKTRFTNFIINFDRNQITKYLKSQQSTQQTHTHTQIGRSADIRSVRDNCIYGVLHFIQWLFGGPYSNNSKQIEQRLDGTRNVNSNEFFLLW